MLTITTSAQEQIKKVLSSKDRQGLHLSITGRGKEDYEYGFKLINREEAHEDDTTIEIGEYTVYIDHSSAENLEGATLDFYGLGRASFHINNPNALWEDNTARAVQRIVSEKINPGIALHGGFVTLKDVEDDNVYIEFGGGCMGCGASQITLKLGIERMIREAVPEVKEIIDVTDHSAGTNPFYSTESGESPFTSNR